VDLIRDSDRIEHMLEHCLAHDRVKGAFREREIVGIADHLRSGPQGDVGLDALDARVVEQGLRALASATRPDDQHSGALLRARAHQFGQELKVLPRPEIQRQRRQPPIDDLRQPAVVGDRGREAVESLLVGDPERAPALVDEDGNAFDDGVNGTLVGSDQRSIGSSLERLAGRGTPQQFPKCFTVDAVFAEQHRATTRST
jgi:hypothetical protein